MIPPDFEDPAFSKYVDLDLLIQAWDSKDPQLLTDVALQLAEGERVLLRSHKTIGSNELLNIAFRVASEKKDANAISRLKAIAEERGSEDLKSKMALAEKLLSETRSSDSELVVSVQETTPAQYSRLHGLMERVSAARLSQDMESLDNLDGEIDDALELTERQREYLRRIMSGARAECGEEGTRDPGIDALNRLQSECRGRGNVLPDAVAVGQDYGIGEDDDYIAGGGPLPVDESDDLVRLEAESRDWLDDLLRPPPPQEPRPAGNMGVRGYVEQLEEESRSLPSLPADVVDPAFDRYVDLTLVIWAVDQLNPQSLTDVALQTAEGEKALARPRRGISADVLLDLALKSAVEAADTETLTRLQQAATVLDKPYFLEQVVAASKLANTTRAGDSDLLIPVDGTTEDEFWKIKEYTESIRRAQLLGDVEGIEQLATAMDQEESLPQEHLDYLKKLASEARAAMPEKADPTVSMLKKLSDASRGDSFSSNRNEVRSHIASNGWNPVYGELINEAEWAKFSASIYYGNPAGYFQDYYQRTVDRISRELPNVARSSVENAVREALKGRNIKLGNYGIKGGIATYQRWKEVSAHVPDGTERYKIYGPVNPLTGKRTWTWGWRPRMKLVKNRIPLPNHHQPYVAFRYYTTSNGSSGSSTGVTSSSIQKRWKVTNATTDGEILHVRVYRAESPGKDGKKEWHFELSPGQTMTFSGTGVGSTPPHMLISYWNDRNNAQPRGRIDVQNIHYKVSGKRGQFRSESLGPVSSR